MSELLNEFEEVIAVVESKDGQVVIRQDEVIALYPEQARRYIEMLRDVLAIATEEDYRA